MSRVRCDDCGDFKPACDCRAVYTKTTRLARVVARTASIGLAGNATATAVASDIEALNDPESRAVLALERQAVAISKALRAALCPCGDASCVWSAQCVTVARRAVRCG